MTKRRFTPLEINVIRRDYAAYVPVIEIARKLDRDEPTVRQKILSLGLRRSAAVSKVLAWAPPYLVEQLGTSMTSEQFWAACWAWREEQKQQQQIANEATATELDEAVRAKCAEIDQRHDLSRKGKMIAKRLAGMTLEAIGQQHGITRERVRQITTKPKLYAITNKMRINRIEKLHNRRQKVEHKLNQIEQKYNSLIQQHVDQIVDLFNAAPELVRQEVLRRLQEPLPQEPITTSVYDEVFIPDPQPEETAGAMYPREQERTP